MTRTDLIRGYGEALSKGKTKRELVELSRGFRGRYLGPLLDDARPIYNANLERVEGRGSPADCDAAVNKMLRIDTQ